MVASILQTPHISHGHKYLARLEMLKTIYGSYRKIMDHLNHNLIHDEII